MIDSEKRSGWHDNSVLPEVGSHIIVRFVNDLGWYFAAGIAVGTTDTKEIVFGDVLSGTLYDWKQTVIRWAYLKHEGL